MVRQGCTAWYAPSFWYDRYVKFYYVYVLQSLKVDWVYVGSTSDLKQRFKSHNNKENLSTKGKTTLKTMLKDYFLIR